MYNAYIVKIKCSMGTSVIIVTRLRAVLPDNKGSISGMRRRLIGTP
jgi:hypothetical protein